MNHDNERAFAFCHALFAVQFVSFVISALSDHSVLLLGPITFCLTFFTTPFLILGYGYRYLNFTENWLWEGFPLVAELFLAILFVSSMIYGIRLEYSARSLFVVLLVAYVVDVAICALGYFVYSRKTQASVGQSTVTNHS